MQPTRQVPASLSPAAARNYAAAGCRLPTSRADDWNGKCREYGTVALSSGTLLQYQIRMHLKRFQTDRQDRQTGNFIKIVQSMMFCNYNVTQ